MYFMTPESQCVSNSSYTFPQLTFAMVSNYCSLTRFTDSSCVKLVSLPLQETKPNHVGAANNTIKIQWVFSLTRTAFAIGRHSRIYENLQTYFRTPYPRLWVIQPKQVLMLYHTPAGVAIKQNRLVVRGSVLEPWPLDRCSSHQPFKSRSLHLTQGRLQQAEQARPASRPATHRSASYKQVWHWFEINLTLPSQ